MDKCLNCNNEFSGNYCNNCGQKKSKGTLTMKMVMKDFVENVFLFDSRLYKTLIGLLIKPGHTVSTYLSGKRKTYLPPFQFFLLFMTLYLLIFNFFGDRVMTMINRGIQPDQTNLSKLELTQALVRQNLDILYFILTPIIAFYVWLFFKKIKYNFPETLLFSLYVVGVSFLLSSITVLATLIEPKIFFVKIIIIFGYFPFAIIQYTGSTSFGGILKSLIAILLSYLTFIFTVIIFITFYVFVILN